MTVHFGRVEAKKEAKNERTCVLPSEPETRGIRMGLRSELESLKLNEEPGRGSDRSDDEERGAYEVERVVRRERNMVSR